MANAPFTVAIVGRPNVGKSTLFNRIVGQRVSIVDDRPGVTRDVISRKFEWNGVTIQFLDTGGYETAGRSELEIGIREHIEEAVELTDALILVVDITTGPTAEDEEAVNFLRRCGRPVILAANKADTIRREEEGLVDFMGWGFEEIVAVSALHGHGTGDLLDEVVKTLPERAGEVDVPEQEDLIRVAIVGRPNVGKSTLLNNLVGEKKALVTSIPGTTRDPVDTLVEKDGQAYLLVDTAGIRRRGKIKEIEKYAVVRGRVAIERADVALLLVDAEEGITETDAHVFGEAWDAGCACVVLVNKWDLVEKETGTSGEFAKKIHETFKFLRPCPIQFISALTGQRTGRIWDDLRRVYNAHDLRVGTSELNNKLEGWLAHCPPHGIRGRHPKIMYMSQVESAPPTFVVFAKNPDALHLTYQRHLINELRKEYGFEGTPIRLWVRPASRKAAKNFEVAATLPK